MPVDQKHCRVVFRKLSRELAKITKHTGPEAVHKFRTGTRRVETVIEELVPDPDRSTRKLLKTLHRLRKKAGKVRDLDVQIASLRNLKITRDGLQKSQLLRTLAAERARKENKLFAVLDKDSIRGLRKRLKRSCDTLEIAEGMEPLVLALRTLSEVVSDRSPLTQKLVHRYRIAGKRARYLIEIAEEDKESEATIEKLKKLQDIVGEWHDWLTLTQRAEDAFGGVKQSALVAALRNLTRAKFRESVDAIVQIRPILSGERIGLRPAPAASRKPSAASKTPSAVAA
ncbi:MAG: CHAD domain-containing protein [Terriglobales bacterium]